MAKNSKALPNQKRYNFKCFLLFPGLWGFTVQAGDGHEGELRHQQPQRSLIKTQECFNNKVMS